MKGGFSNYGKILSVAYHGRRFPSNDFETVWRPEKHRSGLKKKAA
jgi:hypothetical protein